MSVPLIRLNCVSNLFARQMHFVREGDREEGHAHEFDHLTLLAAGSLRVIAEGRFKEFKAPYMIYIKKNVRHELIALEDHTLAYCIHALRNGPNVEDIIDPDSIPEGGNALDLGLANPV